VAVGVVTVLHLVLALYLPQAAVVVVIRVMMGKVVALAVAAVGVNPHRAVLVTKEGILLLRDMLVVLVVLLGNPVLRTMAVAAAAVTLTLLVKLVVAPQAAVRLTAL
jgi:hypothetical protein